MKTYIYTRLSEDRDGEQVATVRQEADCRDYATKRDWPIAGVYSDVDSAYQKHVVRSNFERLLGDVEAGGAARILVWKLDRLVRQPRDNERVIDALEARGGELVSLNDPVDLSGPMGLSMLRIGVVMAHQASADTSLRVKRAMLDLAKAGKPTGGGRRAFGWTKFRAEVVPEEKLLVQEAATRVLQGENPGTVCADWNRRGIKTTMDGEWGHTVMRRMLFNPAMIGRRIHNGVDVGKGDWEPLLSDEVFAQLAVKLDPERRRNHTRGSSRTHLLTGGILRCWQCGAAMVARPKDTGVRRYVCAKGAGLPGCGHTYIQAETLEEFILDAVIAFVDGPEFTGLLRAAAEQADAGEVLTALHADEDALETLATDFYVDRAIDRPAYLKTRETLERRIAGLRDQLARLTGESVLAGLPTGEAAIREAWASRDLAWRQGLLRVVLESVTIGPGLGGRRQFDPRRVTIQWRS